MLLNFYIDIFEKQKTEVFDFKEYDNFEHNIKIKNTILKNIYILAERTISEV